MIKTGSKYIEFKNREIDKENKIMQHMELLETKDNNLKLKMII